MLVRTEAVHFSHPTFPTSPLKLLTQTGSQAAYGRFHQGAKPEARFDRTKAETTHRRTAGACDGGRLAGIGILIVDDNETNREVACRILEREGARVVSAANDPQ